MTVTFVCTVSTLSRLMDTNTRGVLQFTWVLLFIKPVVTVAMGTNIHTVLVIDGYLCYLVYGSKHSF